MNLATHIRVLWRFRVMASAGLVLAIVLAVFAAYKVSPSGLERRGTETWSSESSVLVTQKGCPECRTTLPNSTAGAGAAGTQAAAPTDEGSGKLQYADPSRYAYLALFYAVVSRSELVISQLPSHPKPGQVKAVPVDATGSGNEFLPIIDFTTSDATAAAAEKLNREAIDGFRSYLVRKQDESNTPPDSRVELTVLNKPSAAKLVAGRSMTPSVMAFLLCIIATVAVAHILQALRPLTGEERVGVDRPVVADDAPLPARLATVDGDRNGSRKPAEHDDDDLTPSWLETAHR